MHFIYFSRKKLKFLFAFIPQRVYCDNYEQQFPRTAASRALFMEARQPRGVPFREMVGWAEPATVMEEGEP
jgi:hypothetical protein